jgi:hypothetical protein
LMARIAAAERGAVGDRAHKARQTFPNPDPISPNISKHCLGDYNDDKAR